MLVMLPFIACFSIWLLGFALCVPSFGTTRPS
jgi:hypothetical protein